MTARRRARACGAIAVALHDVEPATFERCALIRDWLDDHGVDRVTLLVRPATEVDPPGGAPAELAAWLAERARAGDVIACAAAGDRRPQAGRAAVLRPLPGDETCRPAQRGRLALGGATPLRRLAAPWLLRAAAAACGDVLRLDLHPSDLDRHRNVAAVEALLRRATRRRAVTCDELSAA